jgi:hypothetical protein
VLPTPLKNAGANLGLSLIKSNSIGTFSGVAIFSRVPVEESFSRTMKEALPTFCLRRYSIHDWPWSTVSTTGLLRAPQAVDTATSSLSGIVPKLPSRLKDASQYNDAAGNAHRHGSRWCTRHFWAEWDCRGPYSETWSRPEMPLFHRLSDAKTRPFYVSPVLEPACPIKYEVRKDDYINTIPPVTSSLRSWGPVVGRLCHF